MKHLQTLKNAINGIAYIFKKEQNFRIHIIATMLVLILGAYFSIKKIEWLIIILAIVIVTAFEAINSAIEYISSFISNNYNHQIKIVKDVSAGAVLIGAIGALLVGIIIFLPRILLILN